MSHSFSYDTPEGPLLALKENPCTLIEFVDVYARLGVDYLNDNHQDPSLLGVVLGSLFGSLLLRATESNQPLSHVQLWQYMEDTLTSLYEAKAAGQTTFNAQREFVQGSSARAIQATADTLWGVGERSEDMEALKVELFLLSRRRNT